MPRKRKERLNVYVGAFGDYKMAADNPFFKLNPDGRTKEGRIRKEFENIMADMELLASKCNTTVPEAFKFVE